MLKKGLVYIIDDEEMLVEVFSDILETKFETKKFTSALDALHEIKSGQHPAVIVSDIKMPRLSGLELVAQLKDAHFKNPIILISAHAEKKEAIECLKLGVFSLLEKPVSSEELLNEVSKAQRFENMLQIRGQLETEKDFLIKKFKEFISAYQDRVAMTENIILENPNEMIKNKEDILKFLNNISKCSKLDNEIDHHLKNMSVYLNDISKLV